MAPTRTKKKRPQEDSAPGVQKIKASLRQTRRLLAKDNLAANVRVETERRLKALEADLAQAELNRKEQTMATRYHKVKFFERQKVVRKLNQTKKNLESATGSGKKKLEEALLQHRIDLNYILNYPKTKKYISLFPPEVRDGHPAPAADASSAKTNEEREQVRQWIKEQMDNGTLSREPELKMEKVRQKESVRPRKASQPKQEAIEEDEFFEDDDDDS